MKRGLMFGIVLCFMILSVGVVSAGWFSDVFGGITGNAVNLNDGLVSSWAGGKFNGVDHYTDLSNSPVIVGEKIAISFWADFGYTSEAVGIWGHCNDQTENCIGADYDGVLIRKMGEGDNRLSFGVYYLNPLSSGSGFFYSYTDDAVPLEGKHHYVVSYDREDRQNTKIFLDGEEVSWTVETDTVIPGDITLYPCLGAVCIGNNRIADHNSYLNGTIEDFRVYNRALTQGEVDDLFGLGVSCTDSDGGVDYYKKGWTYITTVDGRYNNSNIAVEYCEDSFSLVEYSCSLDIGDQLIDEYSYSCPNGCSNGACVERPNLEKPLLIEDHVCDYLYDDYYYQESYGDVPASWNLDYRWADVFNIAYDDWADVSIVPFNAVSEAEDFVEELVNDSKSWGDSCSVEYEVLRSVGTWVGRCSWGSGEENIKIFNVDTDVIIITQSTGDDSLFDAYVDLYTGSSNLVCERRDLIDQSLEGCGDLIEIFDTAPAVLYFQGNEWVLDGVDVEEQDTWIELGDNRASRLENYTRIELDYYLRDENYSGSKRLDLEVSIFDNPNVDLSYQLEEDCKRSDSIYTSGVGAVCEDRWSSNGESYMGTPQTWQYEGKSILWFKDNFIFSFSGHESNAVSYDELNSVLLSRIDRAVTQQGGDRTVEDFIQSLRNNYHWSNEGGRDYQRIFVNWRDLSAEFVERFADSYLYRGCGSDLPEDLERYEHEDYLSERSCKTEPVICPPHGEQKKTCEVYDYDLEEWGIDEYVVSCTPGICSGCLVPKWFGSETNDRCIPYGFRFEQDSGELELTEETFTTGGYEENSDILKIGDVGSQESLDVEIYPNNTLAFKYSYWDERIFFLSPGDILNVMDLLNFSLYGEEGVLQYLFRIDDIYYNPDSYNDSYFTYTFIMESPEVNHTYTYSEPIIFNMYCDIDGEVRQQKSRTWGGDWASCQNNYECESNLCNYGECTDIRAIVEDARGIGAFFTKIGCRLGSIFGMQSYSECVLEKLGEGLSPSYSVEEN